MWNFGWKKKVERLRMIVLSAGHQLAKELHPGIARILELFRQAAQTGDGSILQEEAHRICLGDTEIALWEPVEVYGWNIHAKMYRQDGELWWLAYAVRWNAQVPSEVNIRVLDKVLKHLGADPGRDVIIGPSSSPAGEPALPFGWWTWPNQMALYEVQAKGKGNGAAVRIVPINTPESDGYTRIDLAGI